jgi:hypothetical protein
MNRREFFKKAAKGALPILGAIALANIPVIAKASETASSYCKYGCTAVCSTSACQGTCAGSCKYVCYDACTLECKSTCKGCCGNSCHNTCSGGTKAEVDSLVTKVDTLRIK